MDATLRPNSSLSNRGISIVFAVAGVFSILLSSAFWALGALPVVGFFGLDIALLYFCFRHIKRKQTESTHVRVTAKTVSMLHTHANGSEKRAELPTAFVRVEFPDHPERTPGLMLEYGRKAYLIGKFMTPDECKAFGEALKRAIWNARAERGFA